MPRMLGNTSADPWHLVQSLAFIPFDKNGAGHSPILFLGWTLNFEMYFYALFALAMQVSHRWRAELTAATIVIVLMACRDVQTFPLMAYGNPIVLEFIFGMICYRLVDWQGWRGPLVLAALALIPLLAEPALTNHRVIEYGVLAMVLGLAALVIPVTAPIPLALTWLGGSSYALYLTHPYVIQAIDRLLGLYQRGPLVAALATLASTVIVVVLAVAIFEWLEKPIGVALRRRFLPRKRVLPS